MKKFYILAAVALVASAACTKVETVETVASEPAISFQVANYAGQTKAGETSLKDEGFNNFKTWAWYTSSTADNQEFMTPATVTWDGGNTQWAPSDRAYYWPKTGYINFFSFAGDYYPSTVALNASHQAVATYPETTIATDDNILVADGAYGFFNNDAAKYKLDGVTKGVPTLFRHMLSRVKFDIKVDATDVDDTKNHWKVTVTSATVSYRNQGTLVVNFPSTPSISLGADNKPTSAGKTLQYTSQVWTPASVANVTLTNAANVIVETDGHAASTAEVLIADSVVMPQALGTLGTNVTVALTYTLEHTYNGGAAVSEVVPIAATALTGFSPSIDTWNPNTIYTYHIIIKPAADNKILFDPAVEEWASVDTPTYTIK
ncbi:MAG: hypothetical protein IJU34_04390 [Bacteroidales bacterium]|nr:hypothetical protein [Bacteroidales bacterium]